MYGNRAPTLTAVFKRVADLKLDIKLDVYLPPALSTTQRPDSTLDVSTVTQVHDVYFYIHGGAMTAMDRTDVPRWAPHAAAGRRKILISCDYRLAPQAKVDAALSDVTDALTWCFDGSLQTLLAQKYGDSVRLSRKCAVFGGSAGGWLTLLLGTVNMPTGLDSLVLSAIYPMTNVSDDHYHRRWPISPAITYEEVRGYLQGPTVAGAEPDFDYDTGTTHGRHRAALYMAQEALWQQSLLPSTSNKEEESNRWDVRRLVGKGYPPTYLLHGADDVTILPSNSRDMAVALSAAAVEHQLKLLPGKRHFFDMLLDNAKEIDDMLDWVEQQLS